MRACCRWAARRCLPPSSPSPALPREEIRTLGIRLGEYGEAARQLLPGMLPDESTLTLAATERRRGGAGRHDGQQGENGPAHGPPAPRHAAGSGLSRQARLWRPAYRSEAGHGRGRPRPWLRATARPRQPRGDAARRHRRSRRACPCRRARTGDAAPLSPARRDARHPRAHAGGRPERPAGRVRARGGQVRWRARAGA